MDKNLLKALPILIIIGIISYVAGASNLFTDILSNQIVEGNSYTSSKNELDNTIQVASEIEGSSPPITEEDNWFFESTLVLGLGKLYYISGHYHGSFGYTGIVSGKGTLSYMDGLTVYFSENDVLYIDTIIFEVIEMKSDYVVLQNRDESIITDDFNYQTRFEKVELTSAYCESSTGIWDDDNAEARWVVTIDFRNTGTTEATIIGAFVNAKAAADYGKWDGTSTVFDDDLIRVWKDALTPATNQLNFAEVAGHATNPIKMTVDPGDSGKIMLEIKQEPDADEYSFSSGTTIEVSLLTGAGNTYMKMVTLS